MNRIDFAATDYKNILRSEIRAHSSQRGYHSQLAKAAGCQSSFLSQVLHGSVHLNLDQAAGISSFWGLNSAEEDFFLLLVQRARAATPRLRQSLDRRLQSLKLQNEDLSTRVGGEQIRGDRAETRYYSAWYFSAIHVIASIPKFNTAGAISKRLELPLGLVESTLIQLEKMGLIKSDHQRWKVTRHNIHLPRTSPLIGVHHANWRIQTCARVMQQDPEALHYSVLHGLSLEAYQNLRSMLLEFVDRSKRLVEASKEEELVFVGFDCFRL